MSGEQVRSHVGDQDAIAQPACNANRRRGNCCADERRFQRMRARHLQRPCPDEGASNIVEVSVRRVVAATTANEHSTTAAARKLPSDAATVVERVIAVQKTKRARQDR